MLSDLPASELLDKDDLIAITGYKRAAKQIEWLDQNGWKYFKNAAGHPIVGRVYARQKMGAQLQTKASPPKPTWTPNFSKVR